MGDRFDRRRANVGERLMVRRGKPPPSLLAWGLEAPARIGHNDGPPLDEDSPGYVWRRYRWKKVHAAAWKPPSFAVARFRTARAAAAGVDVHTYVATLLDTGRHSQSRDADPRRAAARDRVRAAWSDVMSRVAPTAARIDCGIWLSLLIGTYEADDRHYHDLAHIADMLANLDVHGATATDRDALVLAILYHDIVYAVRRPDNESESADRAAIALSSLGVAPAVIARVGHLIRATAHTAMPASIDADSALLLDLDLAILAAPTAAYDAYAASVRREYAHVSDADWRVGRAKILQHFLDRPRLYHTPTLRVAFEASARTNLTRELIQSIALRPSA